MAFLARHIGLALRETGTALERFGCQIGWHAPELEPYREQFLRHLPVSPFKDAVPSIASSVFIAPTATVLGNVKIGEKASVFYNCVVRGDAAAVTIGSGTNVQDGAVLHTAKSFLSEHSGELRIGNNVTIGHGAHLHSCTVEDGAMIGIGAVLCTGSKVESGGIVAAKAVVPPGAVVKSGELWVGNPARCARPVKQNEADYLPVSAQHYSELAAKHKHECDAESARINH